MKFIKPLVLIVLILGSMITLISLFMPSRVMVARTILIDAPPNFIFSYIDRVETWPDWFSPVQNQHTEIIKGTRDTLVWKSGGEINRIYLSNNSSYMAHFILDHSNHHPIDLFFTTDTIQAVNSLQVEMRSVRRLKWYPWDKFAGIFEDNISGPVYDSTLHSLKGYIEQQFKLREN